METTYSEKQHIFFSGCRKHGVFPELCILWLSDFGNPGNLATGEPSVLAVPAFVRLDRRSVVSHIYGIGKGWRKCFCAGDGRAFCVQVSLWPSKLGLSTGSSVCLGVSVSADRQGLRVLPLGRFRSFRGFPWTARSSCGVAGVVWRSGRLGFA